MQRQNNMKKILTICAFTIFIIFSTSTVFAGTTIVNPGTGGTTVNPATSKPAPQTIPSLQNPLQVDDVQSLLSTIVDLAIFIGMIMAVLVFIFIGFKFVMAQGSDSALKDAKQWFLYAVIGTAVLISAKVIVDVVKNTFISAGVVNENLFTKPK